MVALACHVKDPASLEAGIKSSGFNFSNKLNCKFSGKLNEACAQFKKSFSAE